MWMPDRLEEAMAESEWIAWSLAHKASFLGPSARLIDVLYVAGQIVEGARDGGDGISSIIYQKQACICIHHDSDLPIMNVKHLPEYIGRCQNWDHMKKPLHQQVNRPSRSKVIWRLLTSGYLLLL
jgi:hypothetical protein